MVVDTRVVLVTTRSGAITVTGLALAVLLVYTDSTAVVAAVALSVTVPAVLAVAITVRVTVCPIASVPSPQVGGQHFPTGLTVIEVIVAPESESASVADGAAAVPWLVTLIV